MKNRSANIHPDIQVSTLHHFFFFFFSHFLDAPVKFT